MAPTWQIAHEGILQAILSMFDRSLLLPTAVAAAAEVHGAVPLDVHRNCMHGAHLADCSRGRSLLLLTAVATAAGVHGQGPLNVHRNCMHGAHLADCSRGIY
jgi:hypothetical protein